MDRNALINQVKSEYARLAEIQSRSNLESFIGGVTPEAYYESLLSKVITDISAGKFDHCSSGLEVVEAAAINRNTKSSNPNIHNTQFY